MKRTAKILSFVLALCLFLAVFVLPGTLMASAAQTTTPPTILQSYREELLALGFPESYIPMLAKLHELHPTWTFTPYSITDIDNQFTWDYVISQMTSVPSRNLVPKSSWAPEPFLSLGDANYSCYRVNNGVTYDSGLYAATNSAVKYFMDPRNFLNDTECFMFLDWNYNGREVTVDQVESVLAGCAFDHKVIPDLDGTTTYAQYLLTVGKELGVDPMFLAARLRDENGNGTSALVTGTVSGYSGYYNFFNIGASGSGTANILANGAAYAKNTGTPAMASTWGSASWNTRWKSIYGGAYFLKTQYVDGYKNTLYLQKFNVDPRGTYTFSGYMQAIAAPVTQSRSFRASLVESGVLDSAYNFQIPVYDGMPEAPCTDPGGGNKYYSYTVEPVTTYLIKADEHADYAEPADNSVPNTTPGINENICTDGFAIDGQWKATSQANDYLNDGGNTITDATASMNALAFYGWYNAENIAAFGYEINGVQVWSDAKSYSYTVDNGVGGFTTISYTDTPDNIAPDHNLQASLGNSYAKRHLVEINVGDLEAGVYNISILVKLTDGNAYALSTWPTIKYVKYTKIYHVFTQPEDNSVPNTVAGVDYQTCTDGLAIDGVWKVQSEAHVYLSNLGNTINDDTASMRALAFYGWTNTNATNIDAFGYEINGVQVWSNAKTYPYTVDNGAGGKDTVTSANTTNNIAADYGLSASFANGKRHLIEVNVSNLAAGVYNINLLIRLTDGTIGALPSWPTIKYVKYDMVRTEYTKPTDNSVPNTTPGTNDQASPDGFYIDGVQKNDQAGGEAAHTWLDAQSDTITDKTASMKALAFYGWFNTGAANIAGFGYEINGVQKWDNTKIFSYTVDNGAGGSDTVTAANTPANIALDYGLSAFYANAKRGFVEVNVGDLEPGVYNISVLVKLTDGNSYTISAWPTVTYIKYASTVWAPEEAPEVSDSLTNAGLATTASPVSNWRYAGQLSTINGVPTNAAVGYRDNTAKAIYPAVIDGSVYTGTVFTMSGWALANGGQNQIVWSLDGVTWYVCDTINYADATDEQLTTATTCATLTLPSVSKGAFSELRLDLSSLKGETVDLYLAVLPNASSNAICHFATVENLTLADSSTKLTGASVALGSNLSMIYSAAVENGIVIADHTLAMQFTMNGETTLVPTAGKDAYGEYLFYFTGITPQCMGDLIDASLVLLDADNKVVSVLVYKNGYSVKQNAQNLLNKYPDNAALVQALSDMLAYGEAAQQFTGHKLTELITDGLVGYAPSDALPQESDNILELSTTTSTVGTGFRSAAIYYSHVNQIRVKFSAGTDVTLVVKKNGTTIGSYDFAAGEEQIFYTDALSAQEFAVPFTFELYEGDVPVQTLTYSTNTYAYRTMNDTNDDGSLSATAILARAMYRYGKSCEAYIAGL